MDRARHVIDEADARVGVATFGLLLLLAVAAGADRVLWRSGETNIRLELVAGLVATVLALFYFRRRALAVLGIVEWLLIGWVGLNFAVSITVSPEKAESLKAALILVGLLAIYLAVLWLVRSTSAATWAMVLWSAVGAAVSLFGIVGAALFSLTGSTAGISLHRIYDEGLLTVVPLVTSTIWEPNLFGAFALSTGLVAAALTMAPDIGRYGSRRVLLLCVALCFGGVVLSMTRTVWFVGGAAALVFAAVGWLLVQRRRGLVLQPWFGAALLGAATGVVLALLMPRVSWITSDPWELSYDQLEERVGAAVRQLRQDEPGNWAVDSALSGRVGELEQWESAPTLLARQGTNSLAIDLWQQRPWFGWGTDAFRYAAAPEPHESAWIPNVALHVLFDTGIVGLLTLSVALVVAGSSALRTLTRPSQLTSAGEYGLLGLAMACVTLVICFQMTDGTWMGFSWFSLGLLVVTSRHLSRVRT